MGTTIGNNLKFQRHMRNYKYGMKDKKFKIKKLNSDAIAGCASIMRVERLKKLDSVIKIFFMVLKISNFLEDCTRNTTVY